MAYNGLRMTSMLNKYTHCTNHYKHSVKSLSGRLSRAQVIADVDIFTVVHNVRKGQARDATVHRLLRAFSDLQIRG